MEVHSRLFHKGKLPIVSLNEKGPGKEHEGSAKTKDPKDSGRRAKSETNTELQPVTICLSSTSHLCC